MENFALASISLSDSIATYAPKQGSRASASDFDHRHSAIIIARLLGLGLDPTDPFRRSIFGDIRKRPESRRYKARRIPRWGNTTGAKLISLRTLVDI
jgi:hypothetical protein